MTVTDNVFPQSGDADYAENFAAWLGRGNITDYVETGMEFTIDYSNTVVDISPGKAFVVVDEQTISSNSETRLILDYAITTSERVGVSINANEPNNLIYLNANIGTNDDPVFEVVTDSGLASDDWILIGVIDTSTDSFEYRNREPDADYSSLTARDSLNIPVYSDPSNAAASESSVIYIDGSGSTDAGIYAHDGNEYIISGVREINKLNDVTGIEEIISDTIGNRPAAGIQGRLFIDETNDRIQFDTGSSWDDIGTNPSNITAGDLGFDTATQTELDTHESTSAAHHARPDAGVGLVDVSNSFDISIGAGLEEDGSGNLRVDEDESFEFTAPQIINATLTMGDDINLSNHNIVEPNDIQTSGSGNDSISFRDTANLNDILTLNEGGEVEVNSGNLTDGSRIIFNQNEGHIPLDIIENITIDITAGNGLKNGGTVSLGGGLTLNVEPANFAGAGVQDDGNDNLELTNDSITITAGNGLSGGGTPSLGDSITVSHGDTGTQSDITAGDGAAISTVQLDENGHVTSLSTTDFDSRFINSSGDTMGGALTVPALSFTDENGDTSNWTVGESASSGNLEISDSTSVRVDVDQNGNIRAEGELTEGASL